MALKCNITTAGRVARLLLGLALAAPAIALALLQSSLSLQVIGGISFGVFAIFEAVKGWCVIVHTLESLRRGVTRKRILRLLLGSSS